MRYTYNQDSQKQAIIGIIIGLMQELQLLAPHPDCPQYKGPLFINSNPNFKIASDYDGMLGSMIMESILSSAFSEAVSNMLESYAQDFDFSNFDFSNIDITNIMDGYSEYITDIDKKKNEAHGQGTFARMSGKSISNSFNMRSSISEAMQAFYDDLPKRMTIERNMAYYAKQLDDLNAMPAYQYAAAPAQPQMAA